MEIDELKKHIESLMGRILTTDEIIIMGVGYVQGLAEGAREMESEADKKKSFFL